jgi:hypothetical protein
MEHQCRYQEPGRVTGGVFDADAGAGAGSVHQGNIVAAMDG